MSLATTGGGGGAGLSLAASAYTLPPPNATGPTPTPQPASAPNVIGLAGAESNVAGGLEAKRDIVEQYPIISFDLYGSGEITYNPPLCLNEKSAENIFIGLGAQVPTSGLILKKTDSSYKALKKLLNKGPSEEIYNRVLEECVTEEIGDDDTTCVIPQPYLLLGARRLNLVHDVTLSKFQNNASESSKSNSNPVASAIEPLQSNGTQKDVCIREQTLDGSSIIQNDDFDRVAFQVQLLKTKKPFFILPEEIVSIILAKVRKRVQDDLKVRFSYDLDENINYLDYPISIPTPSWNAGDAVGEALLESCNLIGNMTNETMLSHRCIAAIFGELLPLLHKEGGLEGGNKLKQVILSFFKAMNLKKGEEVEEDLLPIIHFVGVTDSGVEAISFQINADLDYIKCLSETGYQASSPLEKLDTVFEDLHSCISKTLPEQNQIPALVVTYGSISSQLKIHAQLKALIKDSSKSSCNFTNWKKTTILSTKEEVIANGCCYLAAWSLINFSRVFYEVDIKHVASSSVGIRIGSKENKGESNHMKIIFDYNRRVPALKYKQEFTAAELVARHIKQDVDDDVIQKEYTKKKYIPQREKAALDLTVQVFQQLERNGIWIPIGECLQPLVKKEDKKNKEGDEEEFDLVACEETTLELSLKENGMIIASSIGEYHSVVQASKNLRSSTLEYYGILILCIAFFGGFLVKSYWEDYTFNRDVDILLHYYKTVLPGSIYDGDIWKARYLVYKYRGRRHVLWKRLENKYDVPVELDSSLWEDEEEENSDDENETESEETKKEDDREKENEDTEEL